jgi:CheY-like chemotaxis protein
MPNMSGFEFIERALREKLPVQHPVKTIVLTFSVLPIDKHQAALYPLAGYLNKPLIPAELLDAWQEDGPQVRSDR